MSAQARSLLRWIVVAAVVLGIFWFASAEATWTHTGFGARARLLPPVNTSFRPRWAWSGLGAVAIAIAYAAACFRLARAERVRAAVVVPVLVAVAFCFAASVVVVRGQTAAFVRTIRPSHPGQYTVDVPIARQRGPRDFVIAYPHFIEEEAESIHSITHPPGPLLILDGLDRAFPDHLIPRALVLMVLSSLTVVPAWFLARRLAGERAGLYATLLMVAIPSFVLYTATSIDGAMTFVVVGATALMVRGLDEQVRPTPALIGGAAVGFGLFFSYACAFIAAFGVLYVFATRPWREAVRALAWTAAGGLVALAAMRLALGFDLFASYGATAAKLDLFARTRPANRPWAFWLLGNPAGWLIMAGAPVAGLALRTLWRARPKPVIAFIGPLAVYYCLPVEWTGLIPGELERTLLFAYPIGATAAAIALRALPESEQPRWVAGCVLLAGMQTIVFESLLLFVW